MLLIYLSKIAAELLLGLNGFEQSLEVAGSETLMVSSLDNLQEESWAVLCVLGEDLQEVAFLVVVDQNLQFSQNFNVFLYFETGLLNTNDKSVIV